MTFICIFLTALPESACGSAISSESRLLTSQTLGAEQDDAVFFEALLNGNLYRASGILIRGIEADWVLIAAHLVKGASFLTDYSTIIIGNGSNYLTDRGQTSPVSEMYIPSSWNPSASKTTEDWAFLRLSTRISAPDRYFQISSPPALGDNLLFTSYSIPYSIAASSALPINGNVMSVEAAFSTAQPASWNSTLYNSAFATGSPSSGYETAGGSGGSVKKWNAQTGRYDQVGMTVAGNTTSQATIFLDFNGPGVAAQINAITKPLQRPPNLQSIKVAAGVMISWDAEAVGWTLQVSNDLQVWTDEGSAITGPGSYTDSSGATTRFFRFRHD